MKYDARFSVVLPASSLASNRLDSFEKMCQRYKLAVELPIILNRQGNMFVVSSGLSLRDAQMLRRQIAGLGFPADVMADEESTEDRITTSSLNTLVVGSDAFDSHRPEDAGDIMSSAWESLELPAADSIDADELVARTPEMLVEDENVNGSTKGVSLMDLMKAVRDAEEPSGTSGEFGFHALDGGFLLDQGKKDKSEISLSFLNDDLSGSDRHQETLDLIRERVTPATPKAMAPIVKLFAENGEEDSDPDATVIREVSRRSIMDMRETASSAGKSDGEHSVEDIEIDIDLSEIENDNAPIEKTVVTPAKAVIDEKKQTAEVTAKKRVEDFAQTASTSDETAGSSEVPSKEATSDGSSGLYLKADAEQNQQVFAHDRTADEQEIAADSAHKACEAGKSAVNDDSSVEQISDEPQIERSVQVETDDISAESEKKNAAAVDTTDKKASSLTADQQSSAAVVEKTSHAQNQMDIFQKIHICFFATAAILLILTLIHIYVVPLSFISALSSAF